LIQFLHLVQLLELLEGMDLVGDCLLLQLMRYWRLEEGVALHRCGVLFSILFMFVDELLEMPV